MKAFNLQTAEQHKECVTELYLHGLGLSEWPAIVFEMPGLEVLCLSGNRLERVPAELEQWSRLRILDLAHNQFSHFPDILAKLPALRRLDLSDNRLPGLHHRFPGASRLRILRLSRNRIKALPGQWEGLDDLEELHLDGNQLAHAPAWIGTARRLRVLNLAQNRLREFPAGEGWFESLESLNLEQNKLTLLPEEIGECLEMRELNIRRNQLENLPVSIGRLRKLRRLWLDHNLLSEIPDSLKDLESLRQLSCQGNRVSCWPGFLAALPHLKTLDLGHNQIRQIAGFHGGWPALEYLGLQQNGLSALPAGIAALPALKTLQLGRNLFTRFPEELVAAPCIENVAGVPDAAKAMRFIQACRQTGMPPSHCIGLFRFWQGETPAHSLSPETIRMGLRLPLASLKKKLLPLLLAANPSPLQPGRSVVTLAGNTHISRQQWKEMLEPLGIILSEGCKTAPTHVVMGGGALEIPLAWIPDKISFVEEGVLLRQVQTGAYLREGDSQEQVRFLLQSRQDATLRLAAGIMKKGGVPAALLTDLYLAWRRTENASLKRELRSLLLLHASEAGKGFLAIKNPYPSREYLEKACKGTEFDAARLWEWKQGA